MTTITEWMAAQWPNASENQKKGYALSVAQFVDTLQTAGRQMIDQINEAKNTEETQAALTAWVKRCDFIGENIHQNLLTLSGASVGTSWPTKQ